MKQENKFFYDQFGKYFKAKTFIILFQFKFCYCRNPCRFIDDKYNSYFYTYTITFQFILIFLQLVFFFVSVIWTGCQVKVWSAGVLLIINKANFSEALWLLVNYIITNCRSAANGNTLPNITIYFKTFLSTLFSQGILLLYGWIK